ncbi:MAG TPA: DUF308 domain-containing protein [Puia sp.]|jgi:uncharacterized membrane protein HdeD (DUF308 family)|nr:DUF308 domain-containing protein [Puia sp.]
MKKNRTALLLDIAGVAFISIGIFCFVSPLNAYVNLVRFSGAVLLINGLVLQVASSKVHLTFRREKQSMRIESIVDFGFGILLVFNPFLTFIVYPLLFGSCIFILGIIKIVVSLLAKKNNTGWSFILIIGILSCVAAIVIIYMPLHKASDITKIIGVFCVLMGLVLILDSIRFRQMNKFVNLLY